MSGFCSRRIVGSSATSRDRPCDSLSSSALLCASMAIGSSGSGISQGSMSSGWSLADSVSPVSARVSLATHTRSPATADGTGRWCLPNGDDSAPTRSSTSWSSCPRSSMPCPDTCTVSSGRSVPEKTRTRLIRPTYGSEEVLTTSAASGPSGSQASAGRGPPSGAVTAGAARSSGVGKPPVTSSSSSTVPRPCRAPSAAGAAASTGWKVPRATARSRSSTSVSTSISSPPR